MSLYSPSLYPFAVRFQRTFKAGNLVGLTVDSELPCVSRESAESWARDAVAANAKRKDSDIHSCQVVAR
jgi:hypothetical protein